MQRPHGTEVGKDPGLEAATWIRGQDRATGRPAGLLGTLASSSVEPWPEQKTGAGKIPGNENGKIQSPGF